MDYLPCNVLLSSCAYGLIPVEPLGTLPRGEAEVADLSECPYFPRQTLPRGSDGRLRWECVRPDPDVLLAERARPAALRRGRRGCRGAGVPVGDVGRESPAR